MVLKLYSTWVIALNRLAVDFGWFTKWTWTIFIKKIFFVAAWYCVKEPWSWTFLCTIFQTQTPLSIWHSFQYICTKYLFGNANSDFTMNSATRSSSRLVALLFEITLVFYISFRCYLPDTIKSNWRFKPLDLFYQTIAILLNKWFKLFNKIIGHSRYISWDILPKLFCLIFKQRLTP